MKSCKIICLLIAAFSLTPLNVRGVSPVYSHIFSERADSVFHSIWDLYGVDDSPLLRENYPYDASYRASYLAGEDENGHKIYSYLWPYSGMLSAASAIYDINTGNNNDVSAILSQRILPGLRMYRDSLRVPVAYSSYITTSSSASDRFYDDNVWLGIDFTDLYHLTGDTACLNEAVRIWQFIESGIDDKLGGGIYWCEQKKVSKNTCSNAPGSVLALRLYEATADTTYLCLGRKLYDWVNTNLRDSVDGLYFDNISINGRVDKTKFAYNAGQMLQAAVLTYKATGDASYLAQAQEIAESAYSRFFNGGSATSSDGVSFPLLCKGNLWFTAVMMRGYVELYKVDGNERYIDSFRRNLDHAWQYARNSDSGLFTTDWNGKESRNTYWLLDQAAMCEMYARIASI